MTVHPLFEQLSLGPDEISQLAEAYKLTLEALRLATTPRQEQSLGQSLKPAKPVCRIRSSFPGSPSKN
jgi:hypothetical protein